MAVLRGLEPDGSRVVTGSDDNTARVWDAATGVARSRPLADQGTVNRCRFSPDGRMVATASADCSAQVWDLRLSLPVAPPLPHEVDVVDVIFLPDGASVATVSLDATVKLWRLTRDESPIEELVRLGEVLSGGTVDIQGGFLRLQPERLRELWQEAKHSPGSAAGR